MHFLLSLQNQRPRASPSRGALSTTFFLLFSLTSSLSTSSSSSFSKKKHQGKKPHQNQPHTMVRISVLGDALKTLSNAEKRGKRQVLLRPSSKVVVKFLSVMLKKGYIGEFEFVDDHRAGKIIVELNGRLNKCGVISPRYDISHDAIEDWVSGFFFLTLIFFRERKNKFLNFFSLSSLSLFSLRPLLF